MMPKLSGVVLVPLCVATVIACGSKGDGEGAMKVIAGNNADSGTGGSGASSSAAPPQHVVHACPGSDGGAQPGVWENVTPSQLDMQTWCVPAGNATCPGAGVTQNGKLGTYGTNAFVLDPSDTSTIYLGTSSLGIWKSTDCGATWAHVDTGTNGAALDQGRNWTMLIDPMAPQTLYATSGYGVGGIYKSTNGGVDWTQMLTSDILPSLPYQGFVEKLTMDPTNHLHILASFHEPCTNAPSGGGSWACMAESLDGGQTWILTNSPEMWTEADGQMMIDSKTWFFGSTGVGLWRTTDGGKSWAMVYSGEGSGCILQANDGTYYATGERGMLKSPDGITWTLEQGSPTAAGFNGACAMTTDGTNFYVSNGLGVTTTPTTPWFWSAPESDTSTWTVMQSPAMIMGGGWVQYDADHHLLYSSNSTAGFWRVALQ